MEERTGISLHPLPVREDSLGRACHSCQVQSYIYYISSLSSSSEQLVGCYPTILVANTATSRIWDFTQMNHPLFSVSMSYDDQHEFFDLVQKFSNIMGIQYGENIQLAAYQL